MPRRYLLSRFFEMSLIGTTRTSRDVRSMSVIEGTSDVGCCLSGACPPPVCGVPARTAKRTSEPPGARGDVRRRPTLALPTSVQCLNFVRHDVHARVTEDLDK